MQSHALSVDEQAVLDHLPKDGTAVSNRTLQLNLDWDHDRYWATRDALVDAGLVIRGRGRGGTVRLYLEIPASEIAGHPLDASSLVDEAESVIQSELSLYAPMRQVIVGDWAKDHRTDPLAVEITALQGRRATGGIWSRPDIVSVEVRTFEFVPGKHLEVVTFEVKPFSALSVQAIYEALAHRRSATRSYVITHLPHQESAEAGSEVIADVEEEARSHGVGFITAGDPSDYQTWEERVEARRVEPDPERLDAFISKQLSDKTRRIISKRLR